MTSQHTRSARSINFPHKPHAESKSVSLHANVCQMWKLSNPLFYPSLNDTTDWYMDAVKLRVWWWFYITLNLSVLLRAPHFGTLSPKDPSFSHTTQRPEKLKDPFTFSICPEIYLLISTLFIQGSTFHWIITVILGGLVTYRVDI